MTIPAFRDGDRQKFIPVPLSNWSDAELAAYALALTDPDDITLLSHERTAEIWTAVDAVFAEFDRRRGWVR